MMKTEFQLSSEERKMMKEVGSIFSKYKGKTRQFGLQLIHSHFQLAEDEILHETHNKRNRVLTTIPVKIDRTKDALATAWQISANGKIIVSMFCCDDGGVDDDGTILSAKK